MKHTPGATLRSNCCEPWLPPLPLPPPGIGMPAHPVDEQQTTFTPSQDKHAIVKGTDSTAACCGSLHALEKCLQAPVSAVVAHATSAMAMTCSSQDGSGSCHDLPGAFAEGLSAAAGTPAVPSFSWLLAVGLTESA